MRMRSYPLYGQRLVSPIGFPELSTLDTFENRKANPKQRIFISSGTFPLISGVKSWSTFYSLSYGLSPDHESAIIRSPQAGSCFFHFNERKIAWRPNRRTSPELARIILRGRALCLLLSHITPSILLHASVVVSERQGIPLCGPVFQGKSTLTACFLNGGFSFLSDDVAVIQKRQDDFILQPGAPEIRLWPRSAKYLSPSEMKGEKLYPETQKLRFCLSEKTAWRHVSVPVPVKRLYVLYRKRKARILVEKLNRQEALIDVLRSFYNPIFKDPEVIRRQFELTTQLVAKIPVRRVVYPSGLTHLPQVHEAILKDLNGGQ
jgi:hypothetical protein